MFETKCLRRLLVRSPLIAFLVLMFFHLPARIPVGCEMMGVDVDGFGFQDGQACYSV